MAMRYIDPEASGTGTGTLSDPFQSWASVSWTPGDIYLQKEASTFVGTVSVTTGGSGENARVTLGTYDPLTGARSFDGSRKAKIAANGGQYGVVLTGTQSYITVGDLEVFGCRHASSAAGIYKATGAGINVNFERCLVRDVYNTSTPAGAAGLKGFCDGARLLGNVVYDMGDDGVYFEGDNLEIAYNTISRVSQNSTGGDCIQLSDGTISTNNFWVHHNELDHRDVDVKQGFIMMAASGSSGGLVEYNTVRGPVNAASFKALYIGSPGVIVRRNFLENGIRVIDCDSVAVGAVLEANIILSGGAVAATQGIIVTANDAALRHNLVLSSAPYVTNGYGIQQASSATGIVLSNNIVSGWKYGIRTNNTNPATEQYNCFHGNETDRVNSNPSPIAIGTGSIVADPLLLDPSRPWLGLRSDSPCWNAGVFIQGAKDRYGRMYPIPSHIGPWGRK